MEKTEKPTRPTSLSAIVPDPCFFILAGLLFLGLGCGGRQAVEPAGRSIPKPGGSFQIEVPSIQTLDPLFIEDVYESSVVSNIFSALVKYDENLAIVPDLAEEWNVSRDGRVYTFRIRSGVLFHDSSPLEVEDIVFTFRRAYEIREQPGAVNEILGKLVDTDFQDGRPAPRITAPDRHTIKIVLRQAYPEFLKIIALDQMRIVPRKYFPPLRQKLAPPFIGTGPFILREMRPDAIVLHRNDRYFKNRVYLDDIRFITNPKFNLKTSVERFKAGKLDFLDGEKAAVSLEPLLPPDHVIIKAQLTTSFLAFNCRKFPLDNLYFRKAIIAAFNRADYFKKKYRGLKPTETILPPGMFGYVPYVDRFRFNPAQAMEFLEKSGIAIDKIPPILFLNQSNEQSTYKELVKTFTILGLKVVVKDVNWPQYNEALKTGAFHITEIVWTADSPVSEQFYHNLLTSNSNQNITGLRDAKMDELVFRLYFEQNLNEKLNIIKSIETRAQDQVAYMPLENYISISLLNPRVQNARMNPFGVASINLDEVWIDESFRLKSDARSGK